MATSNKKSSVSSLNAFLKTFVVIAIVAISAGFYVSYGQLKDLSDSITLTSSKTITDTASVQNLKSKLTEYQPYLNKAANITVNADTYTNEITSDISSYADKSGVSIAGYNTSPAATAAMNSSGIADVNSRFITVTIKNPVTYTNFVHFLSYIESSLPKMQVTGIKISPVDLGSSKINVDPITVEVFMQ